MAAWIKPRPSHGLPAISGRATRHSNWNHYMSDNRKQEKDFTPEVDEILPIADSLVTVSSFEYFP